MQLVINFVITVKPSNTFQQFPIPNLNDPSKYRTKKREVE